jgi:hypothetical protein
MPSLLARQILEARCPSEKEARRTSGKILLLTGNKFGQPGTSQRATTTDST